jgi:regulator of sirC expression with transglutaminase-like and TPR domain
MQDYLEEFARDREFVKLLGRRDDEVDLTVAALELARDAEPDLDFGPTLAWCDARAAELAGPLARANNDQKILDALTECLAVRHGLTGDPAAYDSPDGSYLPQVIKARRGIPISLSLVYLAVADRAGLGLKGVCAPGHFLTRFDTLHKPYFIDAYQQGTVQSMAEALERLMSEQDLSRAEARQALEASSPRAILVRMLNNLKAVTARTEDWKLCYKVQTRLLALHPAQYNERRDWGLIALKSGRPGQALTMIEQCLKSCPEDEQQILRDHVRLARSALAQFN